MPNGEKERGQTLVLFGGLFPFRRNLYFASPLTACPHTYVIPPVTGGPLLSCEPPTIGHTSLNESRLPPRLARRRTNLYGTAADASVASAVLCLVDDDDDFEAAKYALSPRSSLPVKTRAALSNAVCYSALKCCLRVPRTRHWPRRCLARSQRGLANSYLPRNVQRPGIPLAGDCR